MSNEEWNKVLAKEIAKGLIETGVEGAYDSVAKSTAFDYPSIGCSQWEGGRADDLLAKIPNGEKFIGRSYADIKDSGELEDLKALLRSEEGKENSINAAKEARRRKDVTKENVLELRNKGLTISEIAAKLNCGINTVNRRLGMKDY